MKIDVLYLTEFLDTVFRICTNISCGVVLEQPRCFLFAEVLLDINIFVYISVYGCIALATFPLIPSAGILL